MNGLSRNRVLPILIGMFLVSTVGAAATLASSSLPAESTAIDAILTLSDQDQLGFHVSSLAPTESAISPNVAVANAGAFFASPGEPVAEPAQVMHVLAAPDASSIERSVYVVIWRGGDPVPGGPDGNGLHSVAYRGVVIDDHTGAILRAFATGAE